MGPTAHGILQAIILLWTAFPFSSGSSQPRNRTQVSHIPGRFFTSWATRETHKILMCLFSYQSKSIYATWAQWQIICLQMQEAQETWINDWARTRACACTHARTHTHTHTHGIQVTYCNPMDCSLPGSSVCGIFMARILEWVAISSSRGSSWPRNQTHVPCISCIAGGFFTAEPRGKLPDNVYVG